MMKGIEAVLKKLNEMQAMPGRCLFLAMIWILPFQNALERVWSPLSYLDELTALIGGMWAVYEIAAVQKCRLKKQQLWIGIPLLAYVLVGLTGNLIYRYQPLKSAIVDVYTNLKFFFAIGTGYFLLRDENWEELRKSAAIHARCVTLLMLVFFLADRIFPFQPSEVRYGIRSAKLFYQHPTYLAGAAAFLLVLLTVFYEKKNLPWIAAALLMMAFTMRSKAIGCAAVFAALFVCFGLCRQRLRWWHVILAGAVCVGMGWQKISFYFIKAAGDSERSIMMITSIMIMKDYFPIGTGFGAYGSAEAAKHYSTVYRMYGFNDNFWLRDITDVENTYRIIREKEVIARILRDSPDMVNWHPNLVDSFWPAVFGQTGVLGTVCYVFALGVIVKRCLDVEKFDRFAYTGVLFAMAYLLISSVAETAFFNSVAVPLALAMGAVFGQMSGRVKKS